MPVCVSEKTEYVWPAAFAATVADVPLTVMLCCALSKKVANCLSVPVCYFQDAVDIQLHAVPSCMDFVEGGERSEGCLKTVHGNYDLVLRCSDLQPPPLSCREMSMMSLARWQASCMMSLLVQAMMRHKAWCTVQVVL